MVDRDELKESEYDGIQEYDNDLPSWWVTLFWITIFWGVLYAAWFHWPGTPTPEKRLEAQMASLQATRALHAPKASVDPESEEKSLRQLISDTQRVGHGGEIFSAKCAPCHGAQGQGLVGPNLTDDHWIHGGTAVAIKGIVVNGVLAKGMLAWNAVLKPDEIDDVVAYVLSLRGSNPVGAKAPEGIEIKG